MNLDKALLDIFHLKTFRPGQREIIEDLVNGQDVLAMLPTGAGKSLCYQLPAYILNGVAIVISPLLSLMEDQVQQLKSNGFRNVVALNSFLGHNEREIALNQLHKQKIIYVSPEILQSRFLLNKLKKLTISLFIVDEAHCISQWGHEFRTDYLKLAEVRAELGNPPCLAITATATKEVQEDIIEKLALKNYQTHIYSIDRPNIAMVVSKVSNNLPEKLEELVTLVRNLQGPGIIYVSTRKWAEDISTILLNKGIKRVAPYHGGMSNEDRLLIQQQFINDELQLICCTSAFGMGVNKPNIRFVIHFHYPTQLESYLQEIGRAGRDGQNSIAITLYGDDERSIQLSLLTREFPSEAKLFQVLQYLRSTMPHGRIDETRLISETGITEIMWRFIRFHLEEQGVIVNLTCIPIEKDPYEIVKLISEKVTKRIRYKHDKLTLFKNWLSVNKQCRRKLVLEQFDEQQTSRPDNCCDVCGINLENYFEKEEVLHPYQPQDWQDELRKLFHE
ncbi:ATP-dependent DNA helicase RecQ [Anaerobacillus alkaliphilus]|uniref:ATP-dependent DNA helicase RecQ n=1 Tax=Anaerobacillus alkaliphilus TaxID=1548597 RepID=A0A4Q0VX12_9BACI|nr:ATP-dependent DNA helicase RecQ [Anaerobacillus alkaliphilus]RXJ03902.1 ATP-dependent DNA helicase RecQ [Anaerobacillus alkaliphilus]